MKRMYVSLIDKLKLNFVSLRIVRDIHNSYLNLKILHFVRKTSTTVAFDKKKTSCCNMISRIIYVKYIYSRYKFFVILTQ